MYSSTWALLFAAHHMFDINRVRGIKRTLIMAAFCIATGRANRAIAYQAAQPRRVARFLA